MADGFRQKACNLKGAVSPDASLGIESGERFSREDASSAKEGT
jgi:hypothetical protein